VEGSHIDAAALSRIAEHAEILGLPATRPRRHPNSAPLSTITCHVDDYANRAHLPRAA
jgi:hypothetical protein